MPNSLNKAVCLISGALAGVAGAFATQTYMRYQRETRASLERLHAGSQVAEISGGPIEYAIAGAGPPVLISHGAAGSEPLLDQGPIDMLDRFSLFFHYR